MGDFSKRAGRKRKAGLRLGDLRYADAGDGYGDVVAPRHGGPSAKYAYLRDCKKFLRLVAKELPSGLACKVMVNPGGFGVPGDACLAARGDDGTVLDVALVMLSGGDHAATCWRIGRRSHAVDGVNMWIEDSDAAPVDVGARVRAAFG